MRKLFFPLCFVLVLFTLFMPGCDLLAGQLPVINSFDANPASISSGQTSTLSWSSTGATLVSIDQGIGNVALTGSRVVSPVATTVYTLTAIGSAGSVTASSQIIVAGGVSPIPIPTPIPTPAPIPVPTPLPSLPTINSFSAIPGNIVPGGSATLSWNVSDAASVTITGVGNVGLSGNTHVSPGVTTDYILTAANAAGIVTATTQVAVSPIIGLPVINSFAANPPSFIIGSSTLSWNVSNAASISITPGIGSVGSVGSASVSPATTTNYTLAASNPAGTVYHTIQVTRIKLKPIFQYQP